MIILEQDPDEYLMMLVSPETSRASDTAGLMLQPLTWARHQTRVAMSRPETRAPVRPALLSAGSACRPKPTAKSTST